MKNLVTGGLGTIGKVLVKKLEKLGHQIIFCDLFHCHSENYIKCDVSSFLQLQRIFEEHKFDFVYHLAAEFGRWNGEDYYENLWRTNVIGTKNIIRLQEKYKFKMIFISSSEVYGDYEGLMREDVMDKFEIKQLNDYAMTKWVNEMQIMNSTNMFGTETVRVRLFNTYGPGEYYSPYRSAICIFIYHALHDLSYKVFLNHHRTSTYVSDTVNTLCNIIDNFIPNEVYNIGGTEYHDMKKVSDIILDYLNKNDTLVEYIDEESFTTKDKKIDVTKAIKDLKHNPKISLKEGIPKTIEWMRKIYAI